MTKTKINGRNWKLRAVMGDIRNLRSIYSEEIKTMDLFADSIIQENFKKAIGDGVDLKKEESKIEKFLTHLVWQFIQPKLFFIKPFFTFERFQENIEIYDLNEASKKCFLLFLGGNPDKLPIIDEDKESGNEIQLQQETG